MLYSKLATKPKKTAREFDCVNAEFLQKGAFIDQVMAGVYTFLPLGLRVLAKIENIVREEMDKIADEVLMPTLAPKAAWEQTNRYDSFDVLLKAVGANDESRSRNDTEYVISPTHEEIVTPLIQKFNPSYKDLPTAVYQIQTKFRNEARAKSGLLRSREFRMKDLYSFHASLEDLKDFYEKSKEVYFGVYKRLGLEKDTRIVLASGGTFTKDYSHEFQTICDTGEDTIFYVKSKNLYYNKEVAPTEHGKLAEEGNVYPETGEKYETFKASEVGNIFLLHDRFSKAFDYCYTDKDGSRKPVYMGCYGIGTSRTMGIIVEKFHDEKGIIWPANVAPYQIHLIALDLADEKVKQTAYTVYEKLKNQNIEVLFDDREDVTPGEKFADADLIGIPLRAVVSKKTADSIEIKRRSEKNVQLMSFDDVVNSLK